MPKKRRCWWGFHNWRVVGQEHETELYRGTDSVHRYVTLRFLECQDCRAAKTQELTGYWPDPAEADTHD